jgi:mercuric ion transport protein
MTEFFKQLGSTIGASFAGACCLGAAWALSALSAIGAGFLINDAVLIPVYVALLGLSLWLLARSARAHAKLAPLWLGAAGALAAIAGLWIASVVVFAGLAALVGASLWDFLGTRRRAVSA